MGAKKFFGAEGRKFSFFRFSFFCFCFCFYVSILQHSTQMLISYTGRLGSPWQRHIANVTNNAHALTDNTLRSYVLLALDSKQCLILWDPHGRAREMFNRAENNGMTLVDRQQAIDNMLVFNDADGADGPVSLRPLIFGTVSSAADMLHCNSSNGNAMFLVSSHANAKLATVKDQISANADPNMALDSAISNMPRLDSWLSENGYSCNESGWSKRLNAASLLLAAQVFFNVASPSAAAIGRQNLKPSSKDASMATTTKKVKEAKVPKVAKKRARSDDNGTKAEVAEGQKTRKPKKTKTRKTQLGYSDQTEGGNSEWCRKMYLWIERVQMHLTALEHPVIRASKEFTEGWNSIDFDASDCDEQEDEVLTAFEEAMSNAPEYVPPTADVQALEEFLQLSAKDQHAKIMESIGDLPPKYWPKWFN